MRSELLRAVLAARAERRPAGILTDLNSGRQWLIEPEAVPEGPDDSGEPDELNALALAAAREALARDSSGELAPETGGEGQRLFLQAFNPPLRLVVIGAVHITQALAPLARLLDYEVVVVDPRRAWTTANRFPEVELIDRWPDEALTGLNLNARDAVVTLSHDPKLDDPALRVALDSPVFYVGSLGSRRTHAARLERLREAGVGEQALGRIHAPIGLNLGSAARSPAEIALAVMAQITQVLHGAQS